MIDIIANDGEDLSTYETDTERAKNILSIQQGSLTYAADLGIDLKYFLQEDLQFQNESFKAYLIQRLANYSINVASIDDTIENLYRNFVFNLVPAETDGGLIAR